MKQLRSAAAGADFDVIRLGPASLRYRRRSLYVCGVLILAVTALAVLLLGTGSLSLKPVDVFTSLTGTGSNPVADRVLFQIRLPRVLTALLVGGALGASGAVFQSVSRNALGSPDIVGFTTGAATGAIVQILLFDAGALQTSLAAVLSGLASATLVFLLALKGGRMAVYNLVLSGIGLGAILSGLNTLLLIMGNLDQVASAQLWLAGSLSGRTWSHVWPAAIGVCVVLPFILAHARQLALMEMGDETATQLGIPVLRTRLVTILSAVALAAIATAAAGPISLIALAAPQIARRLTASPEVPVLSGALTGMGLLLGADYLVQHVPFGLYMPIGLTTGLLGSLYLLWLILQTDN
ncbi:FecCD family ABC transporter permease [Rhizobium sp. SL86]|uniref:FecCD family ABC transporter permease n=1 Tax=Rhizobium sp. SL86 TaxID=2995148 RepID=UPI00227301E2|nr:iron chelate uptake ABC transporter family permease subunit [Rhizobium sp. SL86]MCY1667680.1 iron chelate uptake ABC transporter family permease subunit [Rhizobium sp. SL86]